MPKLESKPNREKSPHESRRNEGSSHSITERWFYAGHTQKDLGRDRSRRRKA